MKKYITALALIAACVGASAQGVDRVNRSYQETPALPFAPAPGTGFNGFNGVGEAIWEVHSADMTVRRVLERWSKTAGWMFGLEHYAVDRDLPVYAQTAFRGDFRSAVRSLLASSEMTDLPLQPCFYNNSVLRVVPRAELCDRMADTSK
jgi:hypothetical protein